MRGLMGRLLGRHQSPSETSCETECETERETKREAPGDTNRQAAHESGSAEDQRASQSQPTTPLEPQRRSARWRQLNQPLAAIGLLSPSMIRRFTSQNVQTVGDFIELDLAQWTKNQQWPAAESSKALAKLRSVRRCIRLAMAIGNMSPREARMLVAVYRRSPQDVANVSPRRLLHDLERFALSSRGRRMIGNRPLPSLERVQWWVMRARDRQCMLLENTSLPRHRDHSRIASTRV